MEITTTTTYLTVSLIAMFLSQIFVMSKTLKYGTNRASVIGYFLFSCLVGVVVFFAALLFIPQLL